MRKLYIVKIGSNIIDDKAELQQFLQTFANLSSPKILIHGGGKLSSELSLQLGIVPMMVDGRRITDEQSLDVVVMTYAGLINKKVVAALQGFGCNAIGLCGADGNIIPAKKRAVKDIDYGFVGDIEISRIKSDRISALLNAGFTPIIAPITHDENGQLLNTNADTIASSIAASMAKNYDVELLYCFEKAGVLKDVNNDNSVVDEITPAQYEELKHEGIISKGMIPKLENAFSALRMGVRSVYIAHAKMTSRIINNQEFTGTRLHD